MAPSRGSEARRLRHVDAEKVFDRAVILVAREEPYPRLHGLQRRQLDLRGILPGRSADVPGTGDQSENEQQREPGAHFSYTKASVAWRRIAVVRCIKRRPSSTSREDGWWDWGIHLRSRRRRHMNGSRSPSGPSRLSHGLSGNSRRRGGGGRIPSEIGGSRQLHSRARQRERGLLRHGGSLCRWRDVRCRRLRRALLGAEHGQGPVALDGLGARRGRGVATGWGRTVRQPLQLAHSARE